MIKGLGKWLIAIVGVGIILYGIVGIAQRQTTAKSQVTSHSSRRQASEKRSSKTKTETTPTETRKQPTINQDPALDDYFKNLGFSGTVLIVKDQKVILNKGYGLANQTTQQVNDPNTLYPIGSTEKAMIATGILQLQEKHRLAVNDPVAKYLPDFPNGQQMTLADLMHHTSGIVGRNQDNQTKTSQQLLQEIIANGIQGQPGQWHYLDANYIVLTKILEQVSHQSYQTYLKQHIFKPSQMTTADFMTTKYGQLTAASVGYEMVNNQLKAGVLPNFSQLYGVGDLYMTATDLYRFDQALFTHHLLTEASTNLMFKPGSQSHYGMGFYNDPALIVNRGYLSGWSISNGFSHGGRIYIILCQNVKNSSISLGRINGDLYTKLVV